MTLPRSLPDRITAFRGLNFASMPGRSLMRFTTHPQQGRFRFSAMADIVDQDTGTIKKLSFRFGSDRNLTRTEIESRVAEIGEEALDKGTNTGSFNEGSEIQNIVLTDAEENIFAGGL